MANLKYRFQRGKKRARGKENVHVRKKQKGRFMYAAL